MILANVIFCQINNLLVFLLLNEITYFEARNLKTTMYQIELSVLHLWATKLYCLNALLRLYTFDFLHVYIANLNIYILFYI